MIFALCWRRSAAMLTAPLSAHHSFAAEYGNEPANLKGAVTKIEWHNRTSSYLHRREGQRRRQGHELGPRNGRACRIQRNGWTRTTMRWRHGDRHGDQSEEWEAARQRPFGRPGRHWQEAGRGLQ